MSSITSSDALHGVVSDRLCEGVACEQNLPGFARKRSGVLLQECRHPAAQLQIDLPCTCQQAVCQFS